MKICFAVSTPLTLKAFLLPLIRALLTAGHRVDIVANTHESDLLLALDIDARLTYAPIERTVAPMTDLRAVFVLWRIFRGGRYDAVHSLTSKVGLLTMLAAWLARVPVRVHCFTGQTWAVRTGWKRSFLKAMDWLIAKLATDVLADSPSQRNFLESHGVVQRGRICVLGYGSISGVDCERFAPDAAMRKQVRATFGIGADDVLLLFLARVKRSKGVLELVEAFRGLAEANQHVHLLVVGPDEEGLEDLLAGFAIPRFHRKAGFVTSHENFLKAADIFCLPSHYEGFGSVVIEAAACGVPAVAANVYGLSDAVEDGITGLLHAVGDTASLQRQLLRLVMDVQLRQTMGEHARTRAMRDFRQDEVVRQYLEFYRKRMVGG
jgi:glycosyltransferase involved in cell wall biosynthesis